MPLVLTAYGTTAGYALSKLCDLGVYQTDQVLRSFATPRSSDVDDGYQVYRASLPDNSDNQGQPGAPTLANTSTAYLCGDGTYSYALLSGPLVGGNTGLEYLGVERILLSDYSFSEPGWQYSEWPPNGFVVGTFATLLYRGIVDRTNGVLYISAQMISPTLSSNSKLVIFRVTLSSGAVSLFVEGPVVASSTIGTLTGFGFDGTADSISVGQTGTVGTVTTYYLNRYDTISQALEDQKILQVFDSSLLPTKQYGIVSIAFLRGTLAGKALVSGFSRTDLSNAALYVAEIDLATLDFNVIAETETRANASIRATYLNNFGEDFVLIGDTQGVANAQMTRITLPAGTTADNGTVPAAPPTPTPSDGGWTRTIPGVEATWDSNCRPEASTWAENCRPEAGGWSRSCGPN